MYECTTANYTEMRNLLLYCPDWLRKPSREIPPCRLREMLWVLAAAPSLLLAPQMCAPALRTQRAVMSLSGISDLSEACTLGGGRPTGTVIRLSGGMVVDDSSTPATGATSMENVEAPQVACTLSGGRPTGTVMRLMGGMIVDDSSTPATGAPAKGNAEALKEACTLNGGRPSGTPPAGTIPGGSSAVASGSAPLIVTGDDDDEEFTQLAEEAAAAEAELKALQEELARVEAAAAKLEN